MSKVVVITGANSGIGLAAAKLYESNGYFVVLGCRDEKKGLSTEKEIGKKSKFLKIDMTCLLYTSPSPRDLSTSRMPSSA